MAILACCEIESTSPDGVLHLQVSTVLGEELHDRRAASLRGACYAVWSGIAHGLGTGLGRPRNLMPVLGGG